jgi:rod shape determining protein RodA
MRDGVTFRDFDWWLMLMALSICAIGIVEIYSATHTSPPSSPLFGMHWRQLWWVMIGVGCMLVVSRVDYHNVLDRVPLLYLLGLAGLVAVLFVGETRNNSRSWLKIFGFNLQVAELVKLIIIVTLARFLSEVRTERLTLLDLVKVGVLTGIPVALIMRQPDFGTAMMTLPIAVVGAYLAGVQWKHALALVLIALLLLPVVWLSLQPYQKDRIFAFVRPEASPQGSGYQTLQAKIAVGSGGLLGKGIGKGSQTGLGYLPVRWSDSIMAAFAEEAGFVGVLVTLLLYLGLLWRMVRIAQMAKDRAGMYVVMGVVAVVGFHVFMNVAMMIGYMPLSGIPLPLMSYGGSATLFVFLALGLVMNVRMRRFVN